MTTTCEWWSRRSMAQQAWHPGTVTHSTSLLDWLPLRAQLSLSILVHSWDTWLMLDLKDWPSRSPSPRTDGVALGYLEDA